tara:strand:- start:284 stop:1012 length:729 start_codon:yes stop_codon:yes gene_type:complete
MSVEIVTYANKSQGMFEELVNNKYDVPIKVLGWGTKWNGFTDKYKGMSEYLETKRDEDIVIFLDGFDTKINKDPHHVVELFEKCDCKVLVSKGPNPGDRLLGTCENSIPGNSGMYMGYAKYLKIMIDEALSYKCQDDQVNLNTVCKNHSFIRVDDKAVIFENVNQFQFDKDSDALFVSYPGKISFNRIWRGFFEYTQFVYIYIVCLLVGSLVFFPKYKNQIISVLVAFLSFYVVFADKSCTY